MLIQLLLGALVAGSAIPQSRIPAPQGVVNDFANVLSVEDVARLTRLIEAVRAGSQGEIAVVTLPDLGGREVGDVALAIGREWGVGARADIGARERNAGVVVLLVPKETSGDGRGHISIQVGQGAEGFITDGMAGDIRREATPLLQRGAYGPALTLITARLTERYAAEFGFSLDPGLAPRRPPPEPDGGIPPAVILFAVFLLFNFLSVGMRRHRRRGMVVIPFPVGRRGGWGGGFGGGGFGGGGFGGFGGGGGFSGGGSSGSF